MRLNKLKLAGFKSFVEPTTLLFPSNIVGVIGPNGCGKSNVIDAVRWVMGESSAKNLRGGAMTDVIFNGSNNRQPADKAAIELIFNEVELEKYQGQNEIAVRRELGRNGQSTYFLNGIKCRRKDITDLFLGTGLGPRSYAIIEQGMISRLIEAKPDDLRIFFEEAAGISKYKERRKETELHMKQARDNLGRLNEVRNELDKQLNKLQKQAKEAEKYQDLKNSEKLLKAQLLAIRWQELETSGQDKQAQLEQASFELQQSLLTLHNLDQENKQRSQEHTAAQQYLETVQEQFYALEREISRLKQSIEHSTEREEQLQADLAQLEDDIANCEQELDTNQRQITKISAELNTNNSKLEQIQLAEQEHQINLSAAETAIQDWQQQWEEFSHKAATPTQQAQVERTKLEHLEQQLDYKQQRLFKLDNESHNISLTSLESELNALVVQRDEFTNELNITEQKLNSCKIAIGNLRELTQQAQAQLQQQQTKFNQLSGRLASKETLQEAAMGENLANNHNELNHYPILAAELNVTPGWELALEMVLGQLLQAYCVDAPITDLNDLLTKLPPVNFIFNNYNNFLPISEHSLWHKINTKHVLAPLLATVKTADDLDQALAMQADLQTFESVITPQGVWLGANWLRRAQSTDVKAGFLAREQEIKQLRLDIANLHQLITASDEHIDSKKRELYQYESQAEQLQTQVENIRHNYNQVQEQYITKHAKLEHLLAQLQRLESEKTQLQQQIQQDTINLDATRERLYQALEAMEQFADEREVLAAQKSVVQETLAQAKQNYQIVYEQRHQIASLVTNINTSLQHLEQNQERLREQLDELQAEHAETIQTINKQDVTEDLRIELEELNTDYQHVTEQLQQAKTNLHALVQQSSNYEQQRQELEIRSNTLRDSLEELKMANQAQQIKRQNIEEQLATQEYQSYELAELLNTLPEYADEASWQAQIEAIERKLSRLGSVNLAALEEYQTESQRKQYLDQQAEDLEQALKTLENAIRTIDRETRNRFKHTVDTVNLSLQSLFPRLFGGGQAYLELVGDDLLKAGVTIMARPPGKRNSSIHLLSGGEKALTAIALVFAIFELNPAPFCMLDEVDAPLDDTNVGRFCELVKEMAQRVQIIFISHNKITMEMANQLIGVTMQEAGVSRPVPVDIDVAIEMLV